MESELDHEVRRAMMLTMALMVMVWTTRWRRAIFNILYDDMI